MAIDGPFLDVLNLDTPHLHFRDLTWEEATQIMHLSFEQGFECAVWRLEGTNDSGVE